MPAGLPTWVMYCRKQRSLVVVQTCNRILVERYVERGRPLEIPVVDIQRLKGEFKSLIPHGTYVQHG